MKTRLALDVDDDRWNAYVDAHAHGSPYHRSAWGDSLQHSFGHEFVRIAAVRDDRVVGVLPLTIIRSLITGTRVISTPFAGYGGPLADDAEVADLLVDRARGLAAEVGAGHVALHFPHSDLAPPSTACMRTTDQYWAFRSKLVGDPESILSAQIPQKARRMVRLGIKAGLEARPLAYLPAGAPLRNAADLAPHLDRCYELLALTLRRLGTPVYPLDFLCDLIRRDPQHWFVFSVMDGDRVVAAVWTAAHGTTLHPHFVGYDRDYYKVGVANFLYWSLMCHGSRDGFRVIDMGRSKKGTGAFDFKRYMGMTPEPLGYRYDVDGEGEAPAISPTNPRYNAVISIWRRLPLPVVKLVGPRLIGHFA